MWINKTFGSILIAIACVTKRGRCGVLCNFHQPILNISLGNDDIIECRMSEFSWLLIASVRIVSRVTITRPVVWRSVFPWLTRQFWVERVNGKFPDVIGMGMLPAHPTSSECFL